MTETRAYAYDAADRLLGQRNGDGSASLYQLRGDGTRLAEKRLASYWGALDDFQNADGAVSQLAYHYDLQDGLKRVEDLIDPSNTRLYETDASGRLLSEVGGEVDRHFAWDAVGRMVAVTETQSGTSRTTRYGYDWANLRRWKERSTGERTTYLWAAGELLEEQIGSGPALRYQHGAGQVVGVGTERILHDGLGSAVGRVDSDTNSSTLYRYDGWGNLLDGTGPGASDPSIAYAGQHWDSDAGLSYAQRRWYDPRLARFLSEDPLFGDIANPNSLMVWGYANGNPLRWWDPSGYISEKFIDILRRDEVDKQAEYEEAVRTKGRDSGLAKANLASLNNLRDTIQELEEQKDFDDNVAAPVIMEANMMIATAPVAAAAATTRLGRALIYAVSVAGGISGTNEVIAGIEEGDPWKVVRGTSEVVLSGVGLKKTGEEVVESASGFASKAKQLAKGLFSSNGTFSTPAGAMPGGGGSVPLRTAAPTVAPEPAAMKPMQMAKREPSQLARGKRAHIEEPVLPGEESEVKLPSGKRMDRYNREKAHIREIKPDNPRQIKKGKKQVEEYRKEMEKETGRPHTAEVSPYDPNKY
jgi:RHS repeat-associated protein